MSFASLFESPSTCCELDLEIATISAVALHISDNICFNYKESPFLLEATSLTNISKTILRLDILMRKSLCFSKGKYSYTLWNKDTHRLQFYEVNRWVFLIAYHRSTYSYTLDLSCPKRKRLEVSKNVKYIAVTLRASKLQVFKVWKLRDLSLGLPHESISLY